VVKEPGGLEPGGLRREPDPGGSLRKPH